MERVGIELVLKSNLEQKLKAILPMIEKMDTMFSKMNQTLSVLEGQQKKVTAQFEQMERSINNVIRKEKGLQTVTNQVKNVGEGASKATRHVNTLGSALGNLGKVVAPLMALYKVMQGINFVGGEGLDFQKQVTALNQLNISGADRQRAIDTSLQLGSSGKYTMGGGEFLDAFRKAVPVLPSAGDAIEALPEIGEMSLRLRQTGMKENATDFLPKLWEKYGQRTMAQRRKFDEALLKVEQFNQGDIGFGQLLQQSGVAGTAIIGQDPLTAMTQLAYGIKESGSGSSGGGGGSRGRAGFGMQAIDRLLSLGQVTAGTVDAWQKLGWLPGIEAYGKKTGAHGRKLLTNMITGEPAGFMVSSGNMAGAGTGKVSVSQFKQYIQEHPPAFMEQGAADQSAFAKHMILGAAQLAGLKGSPDQMLSQFSQLPAVQQKLWAAKVLPGVKSVGMQTLMEMSVGRYKQSFERFKSGVSEQQGFGASTQLSVQDKWEQMMAQFKTFADRLLNNADVVKSLTGTIDNLTGVMKMLNDNVAPIAKYLSDAVPKTPAEAAGMTGGAAFGGAIAGPGGAIAGGAIGNTAGGVADMIVGQVDKFRKSKAGQAVYEWGKKNFAPAGHAGFLVPPPPPVEPRLDQLGPGYGVPTQNWNDKSLNPPLPKQKANAPTHVINQTFNVHPLAGVDGDKIKKTVADAVMPHIQRNQLKTARKMSYATSEAGGSYTDKTHNAGSGQ